MLNVVRIHTLYFFGANTRLSNILNELFQGKKIEDLEADNRAKDKMIIIVKNQHEKKEKIIGQLEAEIQKKQDQYERLSYEYNKVIKTLEIENREKYEALKKVKEEIDNIC